MTYLFRTIDRTPSILFSSLAAALASLLLLYPSVHAFGAMGIMVAAVAGQAANLLYLVVDWARIRRGLTIGNQPTEPTEPTEPQEPKEPTTVVAGS